MKIYENANDQHVRKVVIYEVSAGLAFDKAGTELLTKEQIVDAFLKGCVVENEGNYKTPTGVNVTDSGAELVFGGGGSGGPEVENAIETGGLGWTESEPKEGFDITWDGNTEGLDVVDSRYKVSEDFTGITTFSDLIGATLTDSTGQSATISAEYIVTEDNKVFTIGDILVVAFDAGSASGLSFTKGIWFGSGDFYATRLYKEASTEEVVHQIDEKYIPSGGSGGGAMVVTFEAEGYNFSCDKTVTEVRTAMAQGMPVIGILNDHDGETIFGIGPCLVDVFSGNIGFIQWIDEGELKFFIESFEDSDGSYGWRPAAV